MSAELYKTFELCCETFASTLNETITNGNELIIFIQDIDNQLLTKHRKYYESHLNVFNFFVKKITRNSILKTSSEFWKKQLNELIDIIGNALKNATDKQLKFALRSILELEEEEIEEDESQFYDPTVCTLVKSLFVLRPVFSLFKNALMPYISHTTWDYLYYSIELLFEYQYVEGDPEDFHLDDNPYPDDVDFEY